VVRTPTEKPPYEAYATIAGIFLGGLAGVAALSRRSPPSTALDLAVLGAATFKVSRTLTRERVGSFVRQPFVEGDADTGEDEHPAGTGFQRAIGELVTCPRCLGTWSAAVLASTQMLSPRFGRLLIWSLGASAANDFLQASFAALCAKANELDDEAP
jgi:Protein of unknown function (DUF1360)